jgi:hypothetical protein
MLHLLRSLTPNQLSAVIASYLGWTRDAFDFFILVSKKTARGRAQADRDTRWAIVVRSKLKRSASLFSKSLRFALPIGSIASVAML